MSRVKNKEKFDDSKWFLFTMLFLVVEYGRPQDILPIGFLRPAILVGLPLIFFTIKYNGVILSKSNQTRMIWYIILLLALLVPFAFNNNKAYYTFYTMIMYMPFIISLIVCVNSIERLRKFMNLYIAIMVYVALYSYFNSGVGSGNYFQDENDVSLYLNMVMPFCYFLFLTEKKVKLKIFYAFAFSVALTTVVISFSRGGFIGLMVIFFIIWLVSPRKFLSLFHAPFSP